MIPLLFTVGAESQGVPCANLSWLFVSGKFPLQILDVVLLLLEEVHEDIVAGGQRGVVQHQLVEDVLLVGRGCG